jgi:hypothetical protein
MPKRKARSIYLIQHKGEHNFLDLEAHLKKTEAQQQQLGGECLNCLVVEFKEVLPKLIKKRKKK